MALMRSILLWGSRNEALRKTFPRFGFIRKAVSRFMPGEDIVDALNAAQVLQSKGITTVVTHLGENLSDENEANNVAEHYLAVLKHIHERNLDCHISLKLTQLGLDFNEELCYKLLSRIISKANTMGNFVWIDMESSPYVDVTLRLYKRARSEYSNVGVCLQSYLYRSSDDVNRLLPLSPSIRLVKGAYAEPKDVAYRKKKDVDANFLILAKWLLHQGKGGDVRTGIGTHDYTLLQQIYAAAEQEGISKNSYEIQMLYGIQTEQQLRLVKNGFRVRVLISYGTFWFPWYMRRLAERPANVLFVLRNIFAR